MQVIWIMLLSLAGLNCRDVVVKTKSGRVIGYQDNVLDKNLNVFLGIPFAKPPVGALRFKRPREAERWREPLKTQTLPNSCWQGIDTDFNRFPGVEMWNPNTDMSEDCLYLNVWSPQTATHRSKLAVMVWIYGGGLYSGTSTLDIYNSKYLAIYGDVIVVSMQYRLGPLGFLNSGTSDAPGNMGFLDQYLALQWVKENIELFGGDPSRITIFGESAGALSTSVHLLSPLSGPLISNAIMQSGSAAAQWAFDDAPTARRKMMDLGKALKCDTSDVDPTMKCLQERDAKDIMENLWVSDKHFIGTPFVATLDDYFLTDEPANILKEGRMLNKSILLGSNANEGTYFLVYGFKELFPLDYVRPITTSEFNSAVDVITTNSNSIINSIVGFEYEQSYEFTHRTDYRAKLDEIISDNNFVCPLIELADAYALSGQNVYSYQFDHISSQNPWPKWMGAVHGYELDILFGHPLNATAGYTIEEETLSKTMIRYWSNFAKTGNPNNGNELSMVGAYEWLWPEYSVSNKEYLVLSTDLPVVRHGLRSRQCAFWKELIPKVRENSSDLCASGATTMICHLNFIATFMGFVLLLYVNH